MLCFLERQRKSRLLFSAPGLICIFLRVFMVLCWRLSPSTAVKMCLIILCFHTAAFLFFWEEMFPLSVWKQAAGQLQVSLLLVVRLPGLHIYYFFFFSVNHPDLWSVTFSPTNHAKFIFTCCHHHLYGEGVHLICQQFILHAAADNRTDYRAAFLKRIGSDFIRKTKHKTWWMCILLHAEFILELS